MYEMGYHGCLIINLRTGSPCENCRKNCGARKENSTHRIDILNRLDRACILYYYVLDISTERELKG